jgi:hypothetical protein
MGCVLVVAPRGSGRLRHLCADLSNSGGSGLNICPKEEIEKYVFYG